MFKNIFFVDFKKHILTLNLIFYIILAFKDKKLKKNFSESHFYMLKNKIYNFRKKTF